MKLEYKSEEDVINYFKDRTGHHPVFLVAKRLIDRNNIQDEEIFHIRSVLHKLKVRGYLLVENEGADIYQEEFMSTPDRVEKYFADQLKPKNQKEKSKKIWNVQTAFGGITLLVAIISIPWWPQWFERGYQNTEVTMPTLVGPLTINSLANAQIPNFATQEDEFVTLKNGEYNFTAWVAEVSDSEYHIPGYIMLLSTTTSYAYGDFNNDGMNDVVATFEVNSGGTGRWKLLTIFLNNEGFPEFSTAYYLGDRVSIESVTASGTDLFVDIITQGPGEPMCCGTTPLSLHLSVYENSIELISEEWGEPETPSVESE